MFVAAGMSESEEGRLSFWGEGGGACCGWGRAGAGALDGVGAGGAGAGLGAGAATSLPFREGMGFCGRGMAGLAGAVGLVWGR